MRCIQEHHSTTRVLVFPYILLVKCITLDPFPSPEPPSPRRSSQVIGTHSDRTSFERVGSLNLTESSCSIHGIAASGLGRGWTNKRDRIDARCDRVLINSEIDFLLCVMAIREIISFFLVRTR